MTDDAELRSADVVSDAESRTEPETVTFAEWRATRPFAGALALILGGLLVAWPSLQFLAQTVTMAAGSVVSFGIVIGGLLVFAGVAALVRPEHATVLGFAGLALSASSFVVAFGGLLIGMVVSGVGGLLCFAWEPPADGYDLEK